MHYRLALASAASLIAIGCAAGAVAQPAPLFPPRGDIPAQFQVKQQLLDYRRRELEIPMRDGKKLHTVLLIPNGVTSAPILLDRTPYNANKRTTAKTGGAVLSDLLNAAGGDYAAAGYIIAIQDVRGKYKSQGDYVMNRPLAGSPLNPTKVDHSTDAYDTIDWLVKHVPESNGRVGTFGTSYDGFTALMSLVNPHPALKASVPINPMVDGWVGDDWFHNGALRIFGASYIHDQTATKSNDEAWPILAYDDYTSFLRYGSAGAYATATGLDQLPFWRRIAEHPNYDSYWQGQAVDKILGARGLTVPTLLVHSLFDQEDIYGAPAVWRALQGKDGGNLHLAMGPWSHGQVSGKGDRLGAIEFDGDSSAWFRRTILLPFLDAHLKAGAPAADTPRVIAFETGTNQWRRLDRWPLSCADGCTTAPRPLYLAPGGRLSFAAPPGEGRESYISDPSRPVTYRQRPIIAFPPNSPTWNQWLVDDQRFAEARPDVLTFTSDILTAPLTVAGHPLADLVAATSGTDSDWVVKLIDVYPDIVSARPEMGGYEWPVAMDILRARFRDDPARPSAVPANQPIHYKFALPAVNHVFQTGHRIMVQVQSSWFPLYDRNPQTFVPNITYAQPGDYRTATQTIFTGPAGSSISLPVIGIPK